MEGLELHNHILKQIDKLNPSKEDRNSSFYTEESPFEEEYNIMVYQGWNKRQMLKMFYKTGKVFYEGSIDGREVFLRKFNLKLTNYLSEYGSRICVYQDPSEYREERLNKLLNK